MTSSVEVTVPTSYFFNTLSGVCLLSSKANNDGSFNENMANPLINASAIGISTLMGRRSSTSLNLLYTILNRPSADKCFLIFIMRPLFALNLCENEAIVIPDFACGNYWLLDDEEE